MRQIHFCAWLLLIPLAASACSGEAFTAGDSTAANENPPEMSGGTPSRSHAGSAGNAGSTVHLGSGGKSSNAGSASGGAATAGSAPTGGMSTPAGGASFSGGNSTGGGYDQGCPSGAITFRMLPSPDLEKNFLCDAGCGTGWLTITDPEGATAFSIFSACGTASCESCEMLACAAAACLPTPLTTEGSELVWTGTYLAKDTCGANMACQRQACVKPGRYKAKACAAINGGASANGACTPKNEQLCAEAEFEFPATATVKLLLKK